MQLLEKARQVVQTGESSRNKKIDFTIPADVKTKVEKLFLEAKLWYKVYGNGKGASEERSSPAQAQDADEKPAKAGKGPSASGAPAGKSVRQADEIDEDEVCTSCVLPDFSCLSLNRVAGNCPINAPPPITHAPNYARPRSS